MQPIKISLFAEIRKNNAEYEESDDDQLNAYFFYHPQNLRLSLTGFIIVKKTFTAYSFELPSTTKTKHRQALSHLEYPYFLTNKRLVLFSEMDAMMIKLSGGVENFLENYSRITKL